VSFKTILPPIENVLEMEPEELAPFLLKYLDTQPERHLNRHSIGNASSPDFMDYAEGQGEELYRRLVVAWMWLEKELFIAPQQGHTSDYAFITPRGRKVLESQDFDAYKKGSLLPSDNLDPILVRKVKPSFIRGDYDPAILQAFKEVEIRVREKAGFSAKEIGVKLMKKAFGPPDGPLVDTTMHSGEQVARMELFAGAIGLYKNPSSHRDVEVSPNEAADIIHFANQLLRIVHLCSSALVEPRTVPPCRSIMKLSRGGSQKTSSIRFNL